MNHPLRTVVCVLCVLSLSGPATAAELNAEMVLRSIERGQNLLKTQQWPDGSWHSEVQKDHVIGITSLAVMALINSGMTVRDTPVRKGLEFLRRVPSGEPRQTYDASLMIMALVAARDPAKTDLARIARLADYLEEIQTKNGNSVGAWSYGDVGLGGGDPSNTQFAVLALREATDAGIIVRPVVWERAREYWEALQSPDGGWGYGGHGNSTGSMTVAGISSLAIIQQMLRNDEGVAADGTPPCCRPEDPYPALERGIRWLGDHFAVGYNPNNSAWLLYYLYGVERAGRLSGRRFFGDHDWYRQGAAFLLANQLPRSGSWRGIGQYESGEGDKSVVGTSLSLLFLSKGLAPVMMSKMKHGPRDPARPMEVVGQDWNTHPRDVRNLMEHISGLPRWPSLLTSQEVDVLKASEAGGGGVDALLQAPILFLTGSQALALSPKEIALLKDYLAQGGFIFACPTCQAPAFEESFRQLLTQILPPGDQELRLLPEDHPVYRSEYLLKADAVQLHGCEVGCRTAVMYSKEDLGCLWSYWQRHSPVKRNPQLIARVERGMQIAINVAAYATGREPPKSLDAPRKQGDLAQLDEIQRGLLQVAQLKHTGQWDAAPHALRRLLFALNETVGVAATTKPGELLPSDPSLFQYRLLYMHGRTRFSFGPEEREAIKLHLSRGGMLFADACCGAKPFDKSFRELAAQLYPEAPLKTIDLKHEIFSEEIGHELKKVRRRTNEGSGPNVPLTAAIKEVDPVLEGVEVDGRFVIVYSKYDLSCALERQAALSCEGYVSEDATRIATNIVLYSLKKEPRLPAVVK
ncbi:MAG TPA: DUF4159 domain-containing protein [Planctomycetaceae bacterium]|nr:DUF4159 domain-containing protein [Planctomycetaceae bacterium]